MVWNAAGISLPLVCPWCQCDLPLWFQLFKLPIFSGDLLAIVMMWFCCKLCWEEMDIYLVSPYFLWDQTPSKRLVLLYQRLFYSPTDAQVNCLRNYFKIYIKIDIKTVSTCFGAVTPSSGGALLVLANVTVAKIGNQITSVYGDVAAYTQCSHITINRCIIIGYFNNCNFSKHE